MTAYYTNYELLAKKIVEQVGKTLVVGIPLGIGKPIGFINALYQLAAADSSIQLTIITGLTLARPSIKNELQKRFIEPILQRLLKDYEDPLYERARELQQVPKNIRIIEFFLTPGKYLHNRYVQENYISSKYTSVVRDALHYELNVFAQQISYSDHYKKYSLSSNSDLFCKTVKHLNQRKTEGKKIAIIGEVNKNLPFMLNDALMDAEVFSDIVDTGRYRTLFALPREEISVSDHLIGLYTSCLIKDDSCLQIGIGKLSNATANALIFRHKNNAEYCQLIKQLNIPEKFGNILETDGERLPFQQGLYASTEMLSDEFMQLYKENILKKRVYDDIGLQRLLNTWQISEKITPKFLDTLLAHQLIHENLSSSDIEFLKKFGIFKPDIIYQSGYLILPSGEQISADLSQETNKQKIIEQCLGTDLRSGKIIHAGFFLGSTDFYQQLHQLSHQALEQIDMTAIARTNSLLWSYELSKLQRQHARFVNSTMMITLGGALVSDGLKNLQEVSGVGGQFDFVNMAQNLPDARSIINCRSTRYDKKRLQSNIIWDYPNLTISRYLRDIFITEYGIADCRSRTDTDIIKSLLNICDSRFQEKLLAKAKTYGKLSFNYEIPKEFQNNEPEKIKSLIKDFQPKGFFKPYPFGSDLTEEELYIEKALLFLSNQSKLKLVGSMICGLFSRSSKEKFTNYFQRMQLNHPKNLKEFFYKKLLQYAFSVKS